MAYEEIKWEDAPSTKTPITAGNLKHMDEQIFRNSVDIEKIKGKTYTATLNAGQTSITFSGLSLTQDTKLNLYCKDRIVSPKTASATATTVTYTFNSYDVDLILLLEVI